MKEILAYVEILKRIIDRDEEKETVFYSDGEWYSRRHSRIITIEELKEWILELTDKQEYYE